MRGLKTGKTGSKRGLPRKLIVALVIGIAVAVLLRLKPWEQAPAGSNVPSWLEEEPALEVPEGHVGFRFYSSFTYVSSADNSTLTDVLLKLPMPHVGWPYPENENFDPGIMWPEIGDWHIPEEDRRDFGVPVYWLHNYRLALYYEQENIRRTQVRDDSALDIKVKPDFTLDYIITQIPGGVKEIKGFLGGRTSAPRMGCLMEATGTGGVYPKARVYVSDLRPSEGVALEGYFSVPENLADDVTLSDLPEVHDEVYVYISRENLSENIARMSQSELYWFFVSLYENLGLPPPFKDIYECTWRGPTGYGPMLDWNWKPNVYITLSVCSLLEKQTEGVGYMSIEKWGPTRDVAENIGPAGFAKMKWKL